MSSIKKELGRAESRVRGEVKRSGADIEEVFTGRQAEKESANLQRQAAQEAIDLQNKQLARIEDITAPFRNIATGTALPTLTALAQGGDVDYQPSQLFKRQLETGREGILQQRAGGAGIKSSGTFENLSDLVSGLAAEDVGRFEQGNIDLLNIGLRGEDILRGTETAVGGNVASTFGNLGQQLQAGQQNLAQSKVNIGQTLGSGITSLGQLALLAAKNKKTK